MAIEAAHYKQARRTLQNDPIIRDMAAGLAGEPLDTIQHRGSETPRFDFMQASNREYEKRGGTFKAHFGAVAEAILLVLKEKEESTPVVDTKTVTVFRKVTFELIVTLDSGERVFFDVEIQVEKDKLDEVISNLRAMPHTRNIQF